MVRENKLLELTVANGMQIYAEKMINTDLSFKIQIRDNLFYRAFQRPILIILFVLFIVEVSSAQQNFKKVGSTGYVFLMIPVSARTSAMGETSIALEPLSGAEAIFSNPAALGFTPHAHMVAISYSPWIAETKHQAAAYVYQDHSLGFFGVSVVRLDMGTLQGAENPNDQIGSYKITDRFTADGLAVGLTYGRRLTDKFSFGFTGKFIQERISVYKSQNFGLDASILYHTGFHSLRLAGTMRNFGVEAKYLEGVFKMPTDFRFGAAMEVFGNQESDQALTLAVEVLHPSDNNERLNVGGECWIAHLVALRGGYKFNYDEESWSAGLGVRYSWLNVDLGYSDLGRLGGNVRMTLALNVE